MRECCDTGLPIIRALWLHHPDDPAAVARGDQYLWGRDILVSPVVEKGATAAGSICRAGRGIDFWTEERVEGGREIERKVDLETMPLHVRAGAILPLGPVQQYVDEPVEGPLTLVVYPGADGAASVYEDDGRSFAHRKGYWSRTLVRWRDRDRRLSLDFAVGGRRKIELRRHIEIRVAGERTTREIAYVGGPLDIRL